MARITGLEPHRTNWFIRLYYWVVKRYIGKVVGSSKLSEPIKIMARHPRLLMVSGLMEMGQEGASAVAPKLKILAATKADMLIGCPF